MQEPNEVKKGYWFYDSILNKPIQATTDAQPEIVNQRRYKPLPITHQLLVKFGFIQQPLKDMIAYEKNGFKVYRLRHSHDFMLMEFGELRHKLEYMHQLQKRYREDVPVNE